MTDTMVHGTRLPGHARALAPAAGMRRADSTGTGPTTDSRAGSCLAVVEGLGPDRSTTERATAIGTDWATDTGLGTRLAIADGCQS